MLPTLDDVAREAGVSRSLASLVMQGSDKVGAMRRARVLEVADRLGYRPNVMARSLAAGRSNTLGVMLDDLHNSFYAEIADGMYEAAEAAGYRLLLTSGLRRPLMQERSLDMLLEHRTDGLIVISPRVHTNALGRLAAAVPMVVVADPVDVADADVVLTDELAGAWAVVEHLVSLSHRHIVHVDGGEGAGSVRRRTSYLAAMAELVPHAPARVIRGEFTESGGRAAAELLLSEPILPTAVFTANDLSAAGLIDTLDRAGVRVPADVSVVGYDNTSLSALGRMSLTTIDQPRAEMGRRAVALVLHRIERRPPERVLETLKPSLVVRHTTAPARQP